MNKILSLAIIIVLMTMALPAQAGQATLVLAGSSKQFNVGQTFTVSITADPVGSVIDTVRAKVGFSPGVLEVIDFKFGSTFSFPSGGNGFDNALGVISQAAGVPGGVNESALFGTITFKAVKTGEASVFVDASSLMLSSGVNQFDGQTRGAKLTIVAPAPAPAPKTAPVETPVLESSQPKNQPAKPVDPEANAPVADSNLGQPIIDQGYELADITQSLNPASLWIMALVLTAAAFGSFGYLLGIGRFDRIIEKYALKEKAKDILKEIFNRNPKATTDLAVYKPEKINHE